MAGSVNSNTPDSQRIRCDDVKPRMAKADLPVRTLRDERAEYGAILRRASEIAGYNRDQTADVIGADKAQVSRWWSGDENAQLWRYRRDARLWAALRIAEAESAGDGVEVETVIRIRRAG